MEKALTSLMLMVGGFVAGVALLALGYPGIASAGNAIARDRAGVTAQSQEDIKVVNAMSELDSSGTWQDTDGDTYFELYLWVKNTGGVTITNTGAIDLFVYNDGLSQRIPNAVDTASYPSYTAAVEGGGTWEVGKTLKITVKYGSALTAGSYTFEVTTPHGAHDLAWFDL